MCQPHPNLWDSLLRYNKCVLGYGAILRVQDVGQAEAHEETTEHKHQESM